MWFLLVHTLYEAYNESGLAPVSGRLPIIGHM